MNTESENISSELRRILKKEEERIITSFPMESRVGLIEITRASDTWFIHSEKTEKTEILDSLYRYGWNKAISFFLDNSCDNSGFPMMQPTEHSIDWAHSVIQHSGRIAQAEQFIDLWKTGVMTLTRGKSNEYCFSIVSRYVGIEAQERQHFTWLKKQIADMQKPVGELLNRNHSTILAQLATNVAPCATHGISYSSTPDLDNYYELAGILSAQLMLGQDSFPGDAHFGGIEFNLYRAVTALLIGWTLKHIAFCYALASKYPDTNLPKILTKHYRTDDLAEEIATALDISYSEAKQALCMLVLNTRNKDTHCALTAGASPPFIEVGKEHLLWPLRGCLDAPFQFLLTELRRQHTKDWDRNLNLRERSFRDELYKLFSHKRFKTIGKSVVIKSQKKVLTDVDAVVFDTEAKVLGLFQLKWQELIGSDMTQRASRKTNFMREANIWVNVISHWLNSNSVDNIAQIFNLPPKLLENKNQIRLFVIGRNSAFFSDSQNDERAAWGIWPQLVRYSCEGFDGNQFDYSDPLRWLFDSLKKDAPFMKPSLQVERQEILIGNIKVIGMPT